MKTATKHTPGPWRVTNSVLVMDKTNRVVADCNIDFSGKTPLKTGLENAANARMIAAAPELLAACKQFVKFANGGKHPKWKSYLNTIAGYKMEEAISKAEGK